MPPARAHADEPRGTPAPTPAPRAVQTEDVDHIIGRRDIATVPWGGIALCSFGVAVSSALRPATAGVPDNLVIPLALIYGLIAAVIVALQGTRPMQWLARQLPVYLFGSTILIGVLCVLAAKDHGLATIFFGPSVVIAMYLGLVLPRRWSTAAITMQLTLAAIVHVVKPDATLMDALTVLGMTFAGWGVGLLCRGAHRKAARIALMLSRSDVLTRTLNRRGFFEQFEGELVTAIERREPVALLVIDLDEFKDVNDERGHTAGDELLRWCGTSFADLVPPHAAVGRLGGDEFGVAVRGLDRTQAEALGHRIAEHLGTRINASVGVATSEDGATTSDGFLRIADAALYQAKTADRGHVQTLVAGSAHPRSLDTRVPKPAMTYQQLVAAGGPPERRARTIHYGWLVRGGLWVIGACGALVVLGTALQGADNWWGEVVINLGPLWVAANVIGGWVFPGTDEVDGEGHELAAILLPATTLGFGLMVAMLAGGGLTNPLVSAFYLKIMFDAVVLRGDRARLAGGTLLVWWLAVVVLAPADQLWVVPYQLVLFGVAHWIGRVGRAAFTDATRARLRIAHTDSLTGLRNRPGFTQGATRALTIAKAEDRPFGLLAFDLDGFKRVNDEQGHAVGDDLLCTVADMTLELFPDAHSIARLGGDEFVLALPLESPEHAAEIAEVLEEALRPVVGASVGWALLLDDGFELEPLMQAADRRSYRAKLQRPRSRPIAWNDQSDDPVAAA